MTQPGTDLAEPISDTSPLPGSTQVRPFSRRLLVGLVIVAALIGAASAAAVAWATGWGSQTVIQRYSNLPTSSIGQRATGVPAILGRVLPGVVFFTATATEPSPFYFGSTRTVTASGTGIVISASGEVVTNAHVVEGAQSVTVSFQKSEKEYPASVIGTVAQNDLALLKVDGAGSLSPVVLGDSARMSVGDDVLTVGYALGLSGGPSVTEGIISATNRTVDTETASGDPVTLSRMLQTDAPISSGNSGGPLVNAQAQVIGINTIVATSSSSVTAQNIGFAISSDTLKALLPELRRGGG